MLPIAAFKSVQLGPFCCTKDILVSATVNKLKKNQQT
uniref:Uncharacterized protein n=1 Tax=Anguilla anguilla TaxID=7936 RepID=A0A0E9S1N3_ANGAN